MAESLITQHIDLWTSAIEAKSTAGRGSKNKFDLYGIKKLRELILELAVRGKLVPQDPTDEPASVLLGKIAAEKAQLIQEKKIKNTIDLAIITDDETFIELPKQWQWVRLGYLFNSIQSGGTPSKRESKYWSGDIPWASVKDLGKSLYISKTEDYITQEGLNSGSKLADKGDILICTRMGLGKIAIAEMPIAFNQDLKAVKLSSCVDVNHFLNTYRTLKIKGTGTTVEGIKQEQLLNYVIGLPPLSEQHRIVAKVDELMALCDQLEQQTLTSIDGHATLVETLLETLTNSADAAELEQNWVRISEHFDTLFTTEQSIDAFKQTILQLAVMGKLVRQDPTDEPASVLLEKIAAEKAQLIKDKKIKKEKPLPPISEDEKTFELPQGWEFARFGDLTTRLGSGSTPRGGANVYLNEGIPFLRSQNVWNDGLILDDIAYISNETHQKMENTKVTPGDILLNITGASLGRSTIFPLSVSEANVSQHVTVIRLIKLDMNRFIHLLILSPLIQQLVWQRQVGVAIEGLSKKVLEKFETPIPPLREQQRIVGQVDKLLSICEELQNRLRIKQQTKLQITDSIINEQLS